MKRLHEEKREYGLTGRPAVLLVALLGESSMKLLSTIAAAGIASAASADLSFTFTFEDLAVVGDGGLAGLIYTDFTSEYVGETLLSIDWDLSISADDNGSLAAVMGIPGGFGGFYGLNASAGVPDLVVTAGEPSSFSGSWDASGFGISMTQAANGFPYLMTGVVAYTSDSGAGNGLVNGTITYNMTPTPGALALLGLAGMGRRRRS